MADDAHEIMEDLHKHIYDLEVASEGFAGGFQGFVGKLPGIAGSLAINLHMANHLAHHLEYDPARFSSGFADPVSSRTIETVRRLVLDFILPHAYEFYCGAGTAEGERLQRLASWILTSGKDRIVASDLAHNVADFRGRELREVNIRVSPLVAGGWLTPEDNTPNCRAWIVNPKVYTQLANRAHTEEARKAEVKRLMGFPNLST